MYDEVRSQGASFDHLRQGVSFDHLRQPLLYLAVRTPWPSADTLAECRDSGRVQRLVEFGEFGRVQRVI